jgi:hypothetical protein
VSEVFKQTQFYLTLRRVSNLLELAKIDPDTGLQEIVGPSLNKVISVSKQRNFRPAVCTSPMRRLTVATALQASQFQKRRV